MAHLQHYNNSSTTEISQQVQTSVHVSEHARVDFQQVQTQHDHRNPGLPLPPDNYVRRIFRVPPHVNNQLVYDPVVISLGPYHHGKPQFNRMEEFKKHVFHFFISESIDADQTKSHNFFCKEILGIMPEIRATYEPLKYSDEELANIILLDAGFLIKFMEISVEVGNLNFACDLLGMPTCELMIRDLCVLENQIPFWILKSLLELRDSRGKKDLYVYELVYKYLGLRATLLQYEAVGEATGKTKPYSFTKIFKCNKSQKTNRDNSPAREVKRLSEMKTSNNNSLSINLSCDSVTHLKAKGIYLRPSSKCLRDIEFTSYHFYGVLRLPILHVNSATKVLLSNIAAFEMSPENRTRGKMLSYINFMKALIETTKDVKGLRENGILYNNLANDEEVVKVFKEIETYWLYNYDNFASVKMEINKHCRRRKAEWMPELIHNYFRSPWTVIAIFATAFLLCLTFLQTYYTMHPFHPIR